MKKTLIIGSLLACFLMLMIPNVSAVEYQTVADANESYLMNEIQNKKIDIQTLRNNIKNINIRELREELHNINIHELREKMLLELKNSDLNEEQKAYITQFLNSGLLLTIIIQGIIIPVILYTISLVGSSVLPPVLALLLGLVIAIGVPKFCIIPVLELIEEETGSVSLAVIANIILFIIDFGLVFTILNIRTFFLRSTILFIKLVDKMYLAPIWSLL